MDIPNATATASMDAITALLLSGSTNTRARLVFQTAGGAEVATLDFAVTPFGAATNGVATANTIDSNTNATGGLTTKAILTDRANVIVATLTVGLETSGADIELDVVQVTATDTVAVTALTLTAPLT
jgi:hypothetical protein